jgi:hypothetical protein
MFGCYDVRYPALFDNVPPCVTRDLYLKVNAFSMSTDNANWSVLSVIVIRLFTTCRFLMRRFQTTTRLRLSTVRIMSS